VGNVTRKGAIDKSMSGDDAGGFEVFAQTFEGGFYFYPREMAIIMLKHTVGSSRRTSFVMPTTVRPYGSRELPFESTLAKNCRVLDFISLLNQN
jgi:hypothetical protein